MLTRLSSEGNLPPHDLGMTNGYVFMISDNIMSFQNNPNLWVVKWPKGQGGTFAIEELRKYDLEQKHGLMFSVQT